MMNNLRRTGDFALSFTSLVFSTAAIVGLVAALAAYSNRPVNGAAPPAVPAKAKKTMRSFGSDEELRAYLKKLADEQKRDQRARAAEAEAAAPSTTANQAATGLAKAADGAPGKDESITNTQHAGVDEGGIVKLHGDHLVVLRRGRLFTVAIGDNSLKPISTVNAFGPEIDPRYTWYDEMLVSDDTVVVIGYSYERGGTEVGLFRIDRAGNLAYRSTYHLRSNDYYSSRNYASRLIGSKLIFYSPLYLNLWGGDPCDSFPAIRKWHRGATQGEFRRIVPATRIYYPENSTDDAYDTALHTVTICDLAGGNFDCKATSVIGPAGRVFYVSPQAVYVWATA